MRLPFSDTKALETQVDEFLNLIVQGALAMNEAVVCYLDQKDDEFANWIEKVGALESQADEIRKHTETTLYTYALIPESRGDVLGLLENMDNVVDHAKRVLQCFDVERPEIPAAYREGFIKLSEATTNAVDNVVGAARAYFRDVNMVRDYINKVDFFESEADRAALILKKQIFRTGLDLSRKTHLRYFIDQMESISDIAENVGERLAIAAIKRTV